MRVIRYSPGMHIDNVGALPRGTGCRYLECITAHREDLPPIAKQWHRKMPSKAELVVVFGQTT